VFVLAEAAESAIGGYGEHRSYWIPVLEIMESGGLEVLLVDTRPLSRVPGRKTDAEDCQWLQTLHSHGLLRGAYRPSEQIGELRTIVRQKAVLVREQADWMRRMHKCLDQMNVRVHHAVKDTQGAPGWPCCGRLWPAREIPGSSPNYAIRGVRRVKRRWWNCSPGTGGRIICSI
jgi:hypothetical protein